MNAMRQFRRGNEAGGASQCSGRALWIERAPPAHRNLCDCEAPERLRLRGSKAQGDRSSPPYHRPALRYLSLGVPRSR